jgi:hypothetical protein
VNVNVLTGRYPLRCAANDVTVLDDGFACLNRDEGDLMAKGGRVD